MTYKVSKGKKIKGTKEKNNQKMKFREEESMDAETWFKQPHTKKIKVAIDKIKFKK